MGWREETGTVCSRGVCATVITSHDGGTAWVTSTWWEDTEADVYHDYTWRVWHWPRLQWAPVKCGFLSKTAYSDCLRFSHCSFVTYWCIEETRTKWTCPNADLFKKLAINLVTNSFPLAASKRKLPGAWPAGIWNRCWSYLDSNNTSAL